jgi:hypothetical protein
MAGEEGWSFLGIGVSLSRGASVGEESEVLESLICSASANCQIGDGVRVWRMDVSKGARVVLEDDSRVESSLINLYSGRSVTLKKGASLIGSELELVAQDLVLESGSSLRSLRAARYAVGGTLLRKVVGSLSVAATAQLDFGGRWMCEGRHNRFQAGVFSSDLVLTGPGQLEEICE